MNQPLVSIIIPTRNAAKLLYSCLESIKRQTYLRIEIIVADNYSADETRDIARNFNAKVILVGPKPPYNDFFTAPIQRRVGATHASGEFLFFIDADMILTSGLIKECVEKCFEGADAVTIPEISFGEGFWSKCKVIERSCYLGDSEMEAPRFIKRSAYELVGGWRDDIGALDDWYLKVKLELGGFKIVHAKHCLFHNEGSLTLKRLFRKKFSMGKGTKLSRYITVSVKDPKKIVYQLTPFRLLKILKRASGLTNNPLELLGLIIMKIIEGVAFQLGSFLNFMYSVSKNLLLKIE